MEARTERLDITSTAVTLISVSPNCMVALISLLSTATAAAAGPTPGPAPGPMARGGGGGGAGAGGGGGGGVEELDDDDSEDEVLSVPGVRVFKAPPAPRSSAFRSVFMQVEAFTFTFRAFGQTYL